MKAFLLASFGKRLAAYLLDTLLLNLCLSSILMMVYGDELTHWVEQAMLAAQTGEAIEPLSTQIAPLVLIAATAYACFFWVRYQAMPAQRLLGLRVIDAKNGKALSPARACIRFIILYVLTNILLMLNIVALPAIALFYFGMNKHPMKQALHDMASRSIVIDISGSAPSPDDQSNTTRREF